MIMLIITILYLLYVKLYLSCVMLVFILLYCNFPIIFELHIFYIKSYNLITICSVVEQNTTCTICYEQINKGIKLPCKCKYLYHIDCIKTWFKEHHTCPLCRTDLIEYIE